METNLPENFLSYHLEIAFPNFVKTRPAHLVSVLQNFNIGGLLTNLISPYKRLTLTGKVSLTDKISFNLISRLVGLMVRIGLVIAGILVTLFFAVADLLAIPVFLIIPIASFLEFSKLEAEHITRADVKSPKSLIAKLSKTSFSNYLNSFFDQEFNNLFINLPDAQTLGVSVGQKSHEPFLKLLETWPTLKNYLAKQSVKEQDFKILVNYLNDYLTSPKATKPKPLGQMLIYGYTNTLERFGAELTAQFHAPTYGRKEILTKIEKILTRAQNNNVILVGDPGVGKHSVLETLSSAINKLEIPSLSDKRLIVLDVISLLASGSDKNKTDNNVGEILGNFQSLLEEAKSAGNIILAIDQIDRIATNADGRTDLTEALTTILTDNSLPLIGLTNIDDFNTYIRPNANMVSLFERVDVTEPTDEELLPILIGKSLGLSQKTKITVSLASILEIIDKSQSLMPDKRQPEKSILILEDAVAETARQKAKQVTTTVVDTLLSEQTKTPVGKITETEAQKLTNLESILHKRIVGQSEAIELISKAMRRARAELEKTARPMGSFLFLGPTGVGKTETAKALAQAYFGDENRMVRFDMTEFQGNDALSRLTGNPNNKTPGQLATQIRENPFGILLVDEFEKASPDVQNLFLQILDEGNLTDSFGKKVSFKNIIIIATSNAAAEFIREEVEKTAGIGLTKKLTDYVLEKGLFSPELINRFDATVVYKPLKEEEIIQVSYLMLQTLAQDLKQNKNVTIEVTPDLAQLVAKQGYIVAFGARPIRRLIQDKIEDQIAKLLISGEIKNGDTIHSADLFKFLS